jgi:RND superfamily putative drug exporter
MFQRLGTAVSRWWSAVLAGWIGLVLAAALAAPPWRDVAQDQEFTLLPRDAPSRRGEKVFQKAFPDERLGSNVVLIVCSAEGQTAEARRFVDDVVEPGLRHVAEEFGGLAHAAAPSDEPLFADEPAGATASPPAGPAPVIDRIRTPAAPGSGALLVSADGKALLIVVELTTEFLAKQNWPVVARVEDFVQGLHPPAGITLSLTGGAVIGRDRTRAERDGARATELLTVVLVVVLLIGIYRAPLLALIPLATVYLAVQLALGVLAVLAGAGYLSLFEGVQIYITILAYGAGVDYSLFLTARYKEELDAGRQPAAAVAGAIGGVGAALVASGATVMCGIAMMMFAQFGKFRQAGYAIPLSLLLVLSATLTFSPALLRLAGRWAFWPHKRARRTTDAEGPGEIARWWEALGHALVRRPATIWLAAFAAMAPFAVAAVFLYGHLTYDLIGGLPADAPGVQGTRVLREHFPAGIMGPVTVLLVNPHVDFDSDEGRRLVAELTDRLAARKQDLGLDDIRSQAAPLGITGAEHRAYALSDLPAEVLREGIQRAGRERYVTDLGERGKVGTRLELILEDNPFSLASLDDLEKTDRVLREILPGALSQGTQVYVTGAPASVRDLRQVTGQDRTRIEILVLVSVFLVLVLLLRRLWLSVYLILSVLFSYYATLGVAFAVFWLFDPHGFTGIDWRVAVFLFTILIAVGEDYNIFLMARVDEEQRRRGPVDGILHALERTGPIISSCGVIMAGTFASLLAGALTEMKQLGFALAFGVLLDTFVVRPILVPAMLLWIATWRRADTARKQPSQTGRSYHPGGTVSPA